MRERLRRVLTSHPLVPAAVAVSLLALAALLLPDRITVREGAGPNKVLVPDIPAAAGFLLIVLAGAIVALYFVTRSKRPHRAPVMAGPRKKRGWYQLAGLLLLPTLLVISRPFREVLERLLEGDVDPTPTRVRPPAGTAAPTSTEPSAALGFVLVLALLLLVCGTLYLVYSLSRREDGPTGSGDVPTSLGGAVALGIEDLHRIASPRAAVIACYSRLQAFADRLGARRAADTPSELLARLTADAGVSDSGVRRLTKLFERAKFSPHEIDEAMRTDALDALGDVDRDLRSR